MISLWFGLAIMVTRLQEVTAPAQEIVRHTTTCKTTNDNFCSLFFYRLNKHVIWKALGVLVGRFGYFCSSLLS